MEQTVDAWAAPPTIERMLDADVERAVEIELASPETPTWNAQSMRDELARAWAHLWVVRDRDARVVAFAVTWIVADELHVLNVATDPVHRRRGLAHALLAHARAFAFARGAVKIVLEVRRSNVAAIALYRRLGFREVETQLQLSRLDAPVGLGG